MFTFTLPDLSDRRLLLLSVHHSDHYSGGHFKVILFWVRSWCSLIYGQFDIKAVAASLPFVGSDWTTFWHVAWILKDEGRSFPWHFQQFFLFSQAARILPSGPGRPTRVLSECPYGQSATGRPSTHAASAVRAETDSTPDLSSRVGCNLIRIYSTARIERQNNEKVRTGKAVLTMHWHLRPLI